ncbi:MAG TPA: TRAP transporter substrate-binding protein DctP [Gemmatimonadaceae bacterium]|nr:TRAP transporter substrate-binding protein DctP [Gemmatimonadaceae bacterium]
MKKILLVAALAAISTSARAQVTIKLGTLAPQGSTWHDLLKELGQRWEQASGGQVKLRIYAGGTQGSEGDMVRKMAVGQLQAAAISNVGMHDVVAEPQALTVPFLFQDEPQMKCAFRKVQPRIEQTLAQKGYVAVQWSTVGAIHLYCKQPRRTPAEMGNARVWVWEGDPKSVEAFRLAGLSPVVLSSADIVPSIQTGMIDCVPNVPLYMLTTRLFERAPHMMDTPWAYMIGATLVKKDTWEKIPADVRPKLVAIAQELGGRIDTEVRRLNQDAVSAMQKQGLKLVPGDAAAWRTAMEKALPVVRGGVVPADFYDQVVKAREACKAEAAK